VNGDRLQRHLFSPTSRLSRPVSIREPYENGRFGLSFELFPPKTAESEAAMWRTVEELMTFEPALVTCTYGAGGSTRGATLDVLRGLRERHDVPVASHLTCVGSSVDELRGYLSEAAELGVAAIVALRGDPPKGEAEFKQAAGGLRYAAELVAVIRDEFPEFGILVAGYPETHQEAASPAADLENLKRKCANGGDLIVTQLFYDNADFFRFRDHCEAAGIDRPIVPGVMPVTNYAQIRRIASLCKARLPDAFTQAFEAAGDDAVAQFEVGVEYAARQVEDLVAGGVPGMHFYVLNKSPATVRVLEHVGLRPASQRLPSLREPGSSGAGPEVARRPGAE
jgi:methylenetetrahydrofolate reductase (NADPH)